VAAASVVGGGPHFGNPVAIGVEASGSFVVADTNWRTLLRVNRSTGQRAPIGPAVLPIPGRRATAIGPEEAGALMVGETTGSGDPGLDATVARYGAQGERTVVSGDGRGSGPTLIAPAALARETSGAWLLADRARRTLYRIDPATGDRTVVSGCVNHSDDCTQPLIGSGPQLTAPTGLAREGTGMLLVGQPGLLLRVDPGSGDRTAVSGGGVGSGPSLGTPAAVAVEASGTVLWADATSRALLRIDPGSGARTIVSGPAAGSGAPFKSVSGLAIEQETVGLVVDAVQGLVLKVDLATGDRTPFSGGPMSGGDALGCLSGLAVEASGALVASDGCAASVVRIDAASGDRTLVSGAARGEGPALFAALDITRESSGSLVVVDPGGLVRIDPGSGDRTDIEGGGEPLRGPLHVAVEPSGSLAVFTAGEQRCVGFPRPFWCWRVGKGVVRVNADTGEGTMVSGGGPSGRRRGRGPGFGSDLRDIAVEHDGAIIVALHDTLYRVDPISGDRSRAVREACCRVRITTPGSVAVEPTGMLAVADRWTLKRVDPETRRISMLSGEEFADGEAFVAGVGPAFERLTAVAVEAGGTLLVASAHPVLPGAAALLRVDPVTGDRSYVSR
jgi:sugar lactone lactonase YvrE